VIWRSKPEKESSGKGTKHNRTKSATLCVGRHRVLPRDQAPNMPFTPAPRRDYLTNKGYQTNQQMTPDLCDPTFQPITRYTPILDSEFTDQPKQNDKQCNLDCLNNTGIVTYLDGCTPPCGYRHHIYVYIFFCVTNITSNIHTSKQYNLDCLKGSYQRECRTLQITMI